MLKDGVAMVKFLKWLKPAVEAGGQTEISIDEKLTSLRAEQKLFRDISFDTIAGYAQHGAIVHYEATPETDVDLKPEGLILSLRLLVSWETCLLVICRQFPHFWSLPWLPMPFPKREKGNKAT